MYDNWCRNIFKRINISSSRSDWLQKKLYKYGTWLWTAPSVKHKCLADVLKRLKRSKLLLSSSNSNLLRCHPTNMSFTPDLRRCEEYKFSLQYGRSTLSDVRIKIWLFHGATLTLCKTCCSVPHLKVKKGHKILCSSTGCLGNIMMLHTAKCQKHVAGLLC